MNRGHTCLIQGYSAKTDGILAAFEVLIDEQHFEVWGIFHEDVYPSTGGMLLSGGLTLQQYINIC